MFSDTRQSRDLVHIGGPLDPDILPARRLQARMYADLGFTDDVTVLDLASGTLSDPWLPDSLHFALARDGEAIGHARLISPGERGLPSDQFVTTAAPMRSSTVEVSALVTARGFGSAFGLAKQLYRAMYHHSMDIGIHNWIAIVEEPLHRILARVFKFPCEVIGPEHTYFGVVKPLLLHLPTVTKALSAETDNYFLEGANPESVARTLQSCRS